MTNEALLDIVSMQLCSWRLQTALTLLNSPAHMNDQTSSGDPKCSGIIQKAPTLPLTIDVRRVNSEHVFVFLLQVASEHCIIKQEREKCMERIMESSPLDNLELGKWACGQEYQYCMWWWRLHAATRSRGSAVLHCLHLGIKVMHL